MADDKEKLHGHRTAIREHIQKYQSYVDPNDKAFALKTVERI